MKEIIHIMANNSSVPYFNWLAEEVQKYPDYRFSFLALYPEKPQMLSDMEQRGCKCYWIEFDSSKRKRSVIAAIPKLVKMFRKLKPDAIHTHLFDDSFPALIAAKLAGVKKRVITKGDTTFHWNYAKKWVWADRFNNFNATDIIALSNESKDFILHQEKAVASKVKLIHHGIPFHYACNQSEIFKSELQEQYGLRNCKVVGTVSRYIPWKGYRHIVQAVAELIKKRTDVKFLFVGEGPQRAELESIIKELNLEQYIILTGWIDRKYIPSLYGIMDVYLHAAVREPFGFVIAEAMANGVPIVSTKTGAAADALEHKKSCFFISERNSEDIVEGIEWILDDDQRRKTISSDVADVARAMYNVEDMLKNYLAIYN